MRLIHTLYEPAGEGPHPTLIAMHGFGASALDLLGLAPYIADGRFIKVGGRAELANASIPALRELLPVDWLEE